MADEQESKSKPISNAELTAKLRAMQEEADRNKVRSLETKIALLEDRLGKCQDQMDTLKDKVAEVEDKLKAKEAKETKEAAGAGYYVVPLLAIVAFTAYLFHRGWAQTPTVAINYNVGEIIGGLLAGTGALVAGAAYAISRRRDDRRGPVDQRTAGE